MFPGSALIPCDNSGVRLARVIHVYRRKAKARVGDLVLISARLVRLRTVKHTITRKKKIMKIDKGQKLKALLVFSKYRLFRSGVRFYGNYNSILVIKKNFFYELVGTRMRTPIFTEVRRFSINKLFSMAFSII
jgi:ribosomal protein L14